MNKLKISSVCAAVLLLAQLVFCAPVFAAGEDFAVTNHNLLGQTLVTPGASFNLHLTLEQLAGPNKEKIDAAREVRFYIDESACSFYMKDKSNLPEIQWFGDNLSGEVTIPLTYDGGSRHTVPIRAKLRSGEELKLANGNITINVSTGGRDYDEGPDSESQNAPYIRLKPRDTPSGRAGERLSLTLTVENVGWENAKNVQIRPIFEDGSVFSPDGVNIIQDLGDIEYDKSRAVSFSFLIAPTAATRVYTLKFGFIYTDPSGKLYGQDSPITDSMYISVAGASGAAGNLVLTDMTFTPESGGVSAGFNIKNNGNFAAKNLVLTLTDLSADALSLGGGTNVRKLGDLSGGTSVPVKFALHQAKSLETGNYPLTVKLAYTDAADKPYEETLQFFVPVAGSTGKTVPKIILSSYSTEPVIARAGENFKLNMTFMNTSATKAVRNIKIFLTAPPGESDNNNNNNSTDKGNVFSPMSASNSFYIDYIAPKGTSAKTLQFFTIPDATPRTYSLNANIQYEDDTGTEYSAEEIIGIPVSQAVKVEVGAITLPSEAIAGTLLGVTVSVFNTGRANVSNLMLNIEGNFQTDDAQLYVGNFNTGATENYEGHLVAEAGEVTGKFLVSYDDPSGEHVVDSYPFTFPVLEAAPEFDALPAPPPQPFWRKPLTWILVVVAAALIFLLRKNGPLGRRMRRGKGSDGDEVE
ncbi:MAG: hypothetical protein LBS10_07345 [Gracilibacteraceae bacterium]|jgi:hypothetical protein|nr:hypothetical protein [Gracilibacteraceae bacterium]